MNINSKYKNMAPAVKASFWFMICNILQKGLAFLVIPIYTRLLTTAEYGTYSVYNSWMALFAVFATLSISSEYFVIVVLKNKTDTDEILSILQGCSSATCVVFFSILYAWQPILEPFLHISLPMLIIMFAQVFFSTPLLFLTRKYQYLYKYKFIVIVTLSMSLMTVAISLLMINVLPDKSMSLIAGAATVQIIGGIILYIYNISKGKRIFDKRYWKDAITYCIPLIPHNLAYYVLNSSDRVMIDCFCSTSDAGIYSLAGNICIAINVITNAIGSTLNPWVLSKLKKQEYKTIAKTINEIVLGLGVLFIGVSLIMPEALLIAASSDYKDAKWSMPPILLGAFFLFLGGIPCLISLYHEKTILVSCASASAAVLNIVLNSIAIPKMGYIAAAYTTMISYGFFALFHFILANIWSIKYKYFNKPFDNIIILLLSLCTILLVLLSLTLYNYPIIRYILIIIIVTIIFILRKNIMAFILKLKG